MHNWNMKNVKFLEILKKEKFFKNRGKTLEIGDETWWPEKNTRVCDKRIECF